MNDVPNIYIVDVGDSRDLMEWMIITGKWCIQEQWVEDLLYFKWTSNK